MGCDLGGAGALAADLFELCSDLGTARARRLQVLPAVAFDLRLAVLSALDFVAQTLQPGSKLGPVDRRRECLRLEQTTLLQRVRVAVFALSHIENDNVGVELRRGVAVDRTGSVVLKGRRYELAGLLRLAHVPHARLGVPLELGQGYSNTLPMRLTHPLVAAHQRRQRNRLRRGDRRVPAGPVANRSDLLTVPVLIGSRRLVPDHLLLGEWVLAFAQPGEMLRADLALQTKLGGKLALPLAVTLLTSAPVVGLLGRKFTRVVRPCLGSRQRLGHRHHRLPPRLSRSIWIRPISLPARQPAAYGTATSALAEPRR